MEIRERISLWDNIKFILIITVVIGHFADVFTDTSDMCKSIYLFVYAFHMPLFIYISGLFHKNKKICSRILFYCSIGFLIKILILLVSAITNKSAPDFQLLTDAGIPWFMFVLAIYTLFSHLLRNQNNKYILIASIILACFVGYDRSISDYLYISRTIVFFPFYWAGSMMSSDMWMKVKRGTNKAKILSVAAPLCIIIIWAYASFKQLDVFYEYRHLFTGRNPFSDDVFMYGPLARLMCYGISVLTGTAIILLTPSKKMPFVSNAGMRTIDVLVLHWPTYILLQKFLNINSLFVSLLGKAAFLMISVAVAIVLSTGLFKYPVNWIKNVCFSNTTEKRD